MSAEGENGQIENRDGWIARGKMDRQRGELDRESERDSEREKQRCTEQCSCPG